MKSINSRGFTIVELLIVIVVIGILAAITIVAYSGIQERAQGAAIISQAKAYVKGLKLMAVDVGRPTTSSCIAPASAVTGGVCPKSDLWNTNTVYDAGFNQSLGKYAGVSDMKLGRYGSSNPIGQMWYHENYFGANRSVLYYAVGPKTDCGLPNVLSPNPGYDKMALLGAKYTDRQSTYTRCMIEVEKF